MVKEYLFGSLMSIENVPRRCVPKACDDPAGADPTKLWRCMLHQALVAMTIEGTTVFGSNSPQRRSGQLTSRCGRSGLIDLTEAGRVSMALSRHHERARRSIMPGRSRPMITGLLTLQC